MDPQQEILNLFDEWNDAIRTGEPERVVGLYADDAVLLPTVSDRVRHGRSEILDYFEHFKAMGPSATITESNIRRFGDVAVNSGLYSFALSSGSVKTLRARFTFVYHRQGGRWRIIEHHSSVLPEQGMK